MTGMFEVRGEKEGTKNRLRAAMMIQAAEGVCKRTVKSGEL